MGQHSINLFDLLMILSAYMLGGVSTGYLLVRSMCDIDIRTTGSGAYGARNVGRLLGQRGFYITLAGDMLKAAFIVWFALFLSIDPYIVCAIVIAIVCGHIWPIWLGFRGGKGIASSLGAFAALDLKVLVIGGSAFLISYFLCRNFLLGWITALLATPVLAVFLDYPSYIVLALSGTALLVLFAHRKNIKDAIVV